MGFNGRFIHWLIAPAVLLAVVLTMSTPPQIRETVKVLRIAGQDVQLRTKDVEVFARFQRHAEGMELHVLIHEQGLEGELLRTRVILEDGQTYEIRLDPEGETDAPEFTFTRAGPEILAVADGAAPLDNSAYASWVQWIL